MRGPGRVIVQPHGSVIACGALVLTRASSDVHLGSCGRSGRQKPSGRIVGYREVTLGPGRRIDGRPTSDKFAPRRTHRHPRSRLIDRATRKVRKQFGEIIDEQIGRIVHEAMASAPVGHAASAGAAVARGLHIDFGIADHHSLGRRRSKFAQDDFDADGIRLLACEAVRRVLRGSSVPS